MNQPSEANGYLAEHVALLTSSYQRWTGRNLISEADGLGERLFRAPFAVLSHNTDADPLFNYANQIALDLFELDWGTLLRLPSRTSAEPVNREERQRLLQAVARQGFIDDYSGVRISAKGRRFAIPAATVWNLIDQDGNYCGQAATFAAWSYL